MCVQGATVRIATGAFASRLLDAGMNPTGPMSSLTVEWGLAGEDAAEFDGYVYVEPNRALRDLNLCDDPDGPIMVRLLELPVDPLPRGGGSARFDGVDGLQGAHDR